MKGKKQIAVLLAALLTTAVFAMAGCDVSNNKVRHSVTFEPDNGGAKSMVYVNDGDLVSEPNAPEMTGYDFSGWYNGDAIYRFTTPVTANITLKAKWDKKKFNVKFMSDGVIYSQETVEYGNAVAAPSVPEKNDYYFAGWMFEGEKYDFSTEITENKEISAKWISNASIEADITAALEADYCNYTSVRTVTETDGEGLSYTVTYKRTATDSYSKQVQDGLPDETRYAVFDAQGAALGGYYKRGDSNWSKYNPIALYYYLPMKLNNAVAADFVFNGESYDVIDESLTAIEYSVFGTTNDMQSLSFYVSDGKISKITGKFTENMELVQTFTDIGATQLTRPELPAVEVDITTRGDKEYTEGSEIDVSDILSAFTVKADGKQITVTADMIDLDGLDLSNPAVGNYTITLTYVSWDNQNFTEHFSIAVNTKQTVTLTFAEILANDYSNVTIGAKFGMAGTPTSTVTNFVVDDNIFALVTANNTTYTKIKADKSYTAVKYTPSSGATSSVSWSRLPRIDLLFCLDADLFTDNGDGTYTLTNGTDITTEQLNDLVTAFKATGATATMLGTPVTNDETKPYNVTITVDGNYVSKVTYQFTNDKSKVVQGEIVLTKIGTTDPLDIPQAVKDALGI